MVPLEGLTEDQLDAVQASTKQHRVIVGGPGSGKSLVLIHRAQRLIAQGCSPTAVKIVVFTKVLKAYLQQAAHEVGLLPALVDNFDRWCLQLYKAHVSPLAPRLATSADWTAMRAAVLDALRTSGVRPMFDAVLIDEGQDLTDDMLGIVQLCSRHITVALDVRQDLYNAQSSVAKVSELLGVPRPSANLLTTYRCTPLVVDLAAQFLPNDDERRKFKSAHLIAVAGVERPVVFEWETEEQEFDELSMRLCERATEGDSTAVILPTNDLLARYAQELRARKLDVQVITGGLAAGEPFDFLRPMLLTYHSVKGLTVDSVFLPGLSEANFSMTFAGDSATRCRLLFVGITRAMQWAWLGVPSSGALAEATQLMDGTRTSSSGLVVMRPKSQSEDCSTASGFGDAVRSVDSAAVGATHEPPEFGNLEATATGAARLKKKAVAIAANPVNAPAKARVRAAVRKPPVVAKPRANSAGGAALKKVAAKPAKRIVGNPDPRLTDLL